MNKHLLFFIMIPSMVFAMESDPDLYIPPSQEKKEIKKSTGDAFIEDLAKLASLLPLVSPQAEPDEQQKQVFCTNIFAVTELLKKSDQKTREFVGRIFEKSGQRAAFDLFEEQQNGQFHTQVACYYSDLCATLYPHDQSKKNIIKDSITRAPELFPTNHLQKWKKIVKRKESKSKSKTKQKDTHEGVFGAPQNGKLLHVYDMPPEGEPSHAAESNDSDEGDEDLPEEIKKQLALLEKERATLKNPTVPFAEKNRPKYKPKKQTELVPCEIPSEEKHALLSLKPAIVSEKAPGKIKEKKPLSWQEQLGNAKSIFNRDPQKGIAEFERIAEESDNQEIRFNAACSLAKIFDPLEKIQKDVKKNPVLAVRFYKKVREYGKITPEIACNAFLSSIIIQDKQATHEWLEQCHQKGTKDSVVLWAQAIEHLLAGDYTRAAEFFAQWNSKKDTVKEEMYSLLFAPVNGWLADYIAALYKGNHTISRNDQAILLYSLGKMFREGPEQWKKQGNQGWSCTLLDGTSQIKIFPLQLIKHAAPFYAPAAYYLGTQSSLMTEYRVAYCKQALDRDDTTLSTLEQDTLRTTLKNSAYEGNFAAAMVLAHDAYRRQKLVPWLTQNKSIASKLYMTEWMAPIIDDSSDAAFLEALRNNDNVLARVLVAGQQLSVSEKAIHASQTEDDVYKFLTDQLPMIIQSYRDLADKSCILRFETALQSLAYHAIHHKFNKLALPALTTTLEKQLKKTYQEDDYSAYLYLRFLVSELTEIFTNKEKAKFFDSLAKRLSKSPEYQLHTFEALTTLYVDVGKEGYDYYIQKIEEHPAYMVDERLVEFVQTVQQIIKNKTNQDTPSDVALTETNFTIMPDDPADICELKKAKESLSIAEKACKHQKFAHAADVLYAAVKNLNLLQYFQATIIFDRTTFDGIMRQLREQSDGEIKKRIAEIDQKDAAYSATLNHEEIKLAKEKLCFYRALVQESSFLEGPRAIKKWITKVKTIPEISTALQEKGISQDAKISSDELIGLITAQCMLLQCTLDHLSGVILKNEKMNEANKLLLHKVHQHDQEVPVSKYDEKNLQVVAQNVLEGVNRACTIRGDYKAAALVLKQAIKRKMFLQSLESLLTDEKKKLFGEIMDTLKQQDDQTIKNIVAEIETYNKNYQETLNHAAINQMKECCRTLQGLYTQYSTIKIGNDKITRDRAYVSLFAEMIQKIPAMCNNLPTGTMDGEKVERTIFEVLAKECARSQTDLNILVGLHVTQNTAESVPMANNIRTFYENKLPQLATMAMQQKNTSHDQPADKKIIDAYEIMRDYNRQALALASIDAVEKEIEKLDQ